MVLAREKTRAKLKKKGFVEDDKGDHIWLFYVSRDGALTSIRTKISHSGKDLGRTLIKLMAKQCKLSVPDFVLLAKCPMKQAQYEEKVKEYL